MLVRATNLVLPITFFSHIIKAKIFDWPNGAADFMFQNCDPVDCVKKF